MGKRALTLSDLEDHLQEQLRFLEASASSFDSGFEGEAKRLALVIRVLLHDTKSSHSLLGQLGVKDVAFVDTAIGFDPNNPMAHGGLVFTALGPPRTRYVAMLDDVPETRAVPFSDW